MLNIFSFDFELKYGTGVFWGFLLPVSSCDEFYGKPRWLFVTNTFRVSRVKGQRFRDSSLSSTTHKLLTQCDHSGSDVQIQTAVRVTETDEIRVERQSCS